MAGSLALLFLLPALPAQELPAQEIARGPGTAFFVHLPRRAAPGALDGRLLLLVSRDSTAEPRFQISDGPGTQMVFGMNVESFQRGSTIRFDTAAFGFPLRRLRQIPPGNYRVQVLLHRYETFTRSDGHVVKLPMDRGEGQQWNRAPGNLLSRPRVVPIDPRARNRVTLTLEEEIPPIAPPKETKYVKHLRIRSELLSKFWGRPMELGAVVLLPEGFDAHPEARYPLMVSHGHFSATFEGFREEPPDPGLVPDTNARFRIRGYNRIQQEYAHHFYREWTGKNFPRFLVVEIQHANPYYDDSYAVNSANLGPYGDAIMRELIPYVEKQFRGIGQGWARFTYGGSTGGWEALAAQIFYPDEFNGCFAACPDPVDFRAYTVVNLYEHENAYFMDAPWLKVPRPGARNYLGEVSITLQEANYFELALGDRGRSGQQWDIWQAVFSPVGTDGYPKPIWDKMTGRIDTSVARYWKEHYDLSSILKRDWASLGPRLAGKIHVYCGDMDNYYLNNAVYLLEQVLESTENPYYGGEVRYGDRAEHCWNGDPTRPNHLSRLRYHQMYLPKILARIRASAPTGADTTSWRY
jgi:hypothetical protein